VGDDSHVLEFSSDPACTSIDMTAVTNIPAVLPWIADNNRVVYIAANTELAGNNVVKDGVCASLVINEAWGTFRPASPFTATQASYTCLVDGQHIVQLPFQAAIPENVVVYSLNEDLQPLAVSGMVPANQPVLVEAQGEVTFHGSGEISYVPCPLSDDILPISTPTGISIVEKERLIMNSELYNLRGQRADTRFRGLIISNRRKYLVK
jgi:glucuronoarabinoxylan endo-1,4-beta-xylanase